MPRPLFMFPLGLALPQIIHRPCTVQTLRLNGLQPAVSLSPCPTLRHSDRTTGRLRKGWVGVCGGGGGEGFWGNGSRHNQRRGEPWQRSDGRRDSGNREDNIASVAAAFARRLHSVLMTVREGTIARQDGGKQTSHLWRINPVGET